MAPRIYTSSVPDIPIPELSIFSHFLGSHPDNPSDYVGQHPGHLPAFTDALTGITLSRAQVKSLALKFGHGLTTAGAKRGDTILMFSQNSLAWPVVTLGAISAGIRCTLANTAYTGRELAHQYHDSRSYFIMTTTEGLPNVRDMFDTLNIPQAEGNKRIIVLSDDLAWAGGPPSSIKPELRGLLTMEELLSRGSLSKEERFDGEAARIETAFLCYSSGTTGKPKGVETTHVNAITVPSIVAPFFIRTSRDDDRMLAILPYYHIFGFAKALLFPLHIGLPVVIQQRFEPIQFCSNIEKYKITVGLVVPPVLVVLSRHEAVDRYNLSSLRYLISGAAPLGAPLTKQVKSRIRSKWRADVAIVQGYGLTETSPTTHLLRAEDDVRRVGSIGELLGNLEARIIADDEGAEPTEAEEGQPGELWVRGPSVMKGYLNNLSATQNAITPDRWFKTGDVAVRDKDGYYYIVDRRKELIKYKGFQVPPAELESVLLTHPDIADAAVIGVESAAEATELPRAYVVHANPSAVASKETQARFAQAVGKWMETQVAKHKYLRGGVVILDAIPKSAAGKILRRELRERAKTEIVPSVVAAKL